MKDESRLIIAFILSIVVIVFFSIYQGKKMTAQPVRKSAVRQTPTQTLPVSQIPAPQTQPLQTTAEKQIKFSNKKIIFQNRLFYSMIDPLGGKIKYFGLKNFTRAGKKRFTFFNSGWTFVDFYPWQTSQIPYQQVLSKKTAQIVLKTSSSSYLLEKTFQFHPDKYKFRFNLSITNTTGKSVKFPGAIIELGKMNSVVEHFSNQLFPEFTVLTNGSNVQKFNLEGINQKQKTTGRALAVQNRFQLYYFRFKKPVEIYAENNGKDIIWWISLPQKDIKSKDTYQFPITAYIGPSDYFIAKKEISSTWVLGTGPFASIGRFVFQVLGGIHKILPNWGWAIIILTVLVKIIFFPLTKNGVRSMKQIQKLRPYLKDIQTKYKDNPQMMQKELMNLYRTYKINPFGGCLPFLIQIPIFIGFFIALKNSIFLRGSPFILWIKDLSMPDTIFHIGTIPVNILPFIMFVTYFFQQKMMPQMDPSAKYMNYLIPFVMLFLFYNFSSGLLLYWVVMSGLGLAEQWYIGKGA
ncbi:MAG: YidC/Oxa1 family insertase periplasmic-domain containing protein [Candidatus Omnitrophica bacterium]|nr:YidC/Oxa1 family insertase periplasmic-domain containing protein [Candidatus Omnitrophota bacterium]